jgi:hypothetical protein
MLRILLFLAVVVQKLKFLNNSIEKSNHERPAAEASPAFVYESVGAWLRPGFPAVAA